MRLGQLKTVYDMFLHMGLFNIAQTLLRFLIIIFFIYTFKGCNAKDNRIQNAAVFSKGLDLASLILIT
jgi:hypothetical protein